MVFCVSLRVPSTLSHFLDPAATYISEVPLLFLTTTSFIKNIPGTILTPETNKLVCFTSLTFVVLLSTYSFSFSPSTALMKIDGILTDDASLLLGFIVIKSSVQFVDPLSLL